MNDIDGRNSAKGGCRELSSGRKKLGISQERGSILAAVSIDAAGNRIVTGSATVPMRLRSS